MKDRVERAEKGVDPSADELVREMRERAESERSVVREEADERVREITARSTKECQRFERETLAEVDVELKAERDRLLGEVRSARRVERLELKRAAIRAVFDEAEKTLIARIGGEGYPALLEALLKEGIAFVGDGAVVQVADDDVEDCKAIAGARDLHCSVSGGAARRGDLALTSADGTRKVENGLWTRLGRVAENGIAEIAKALFE